MKPRILSLIISLLIFSMVSAQHQDSTMTLIPGGKFLMGKNSDKGMDFNSAHEIEIDSFLIDKFEVSNQEYLKFCIETGHKLPEFWNVEIFRSGENYLHFPVVGINWYDAMSYAKWAGKRLPTEAEWEYAARGGLAEMEYPNGNEWTKARAENTPANWENNIEEIGANEANGYGLYNMGGNVWEWTADRYAENYYVESPSKNPKGPTNGTCRVIRGGSWHSGAMCKKVYYRKGLTANWVDFAVGFRCVKDIK